MHPALVVVLVDADAIADAQRLGFGEDGGAGIALFLGAVPVLVVAREVKVGLIRLHLGLAAGRRCRRPRP